MRHPVYFWYLIMLDNINCDRPVGTLGHVATNSCTFRDCTVPLSWYMNHDNGTVQVTGVDICTCNLEYTIVLARTINTKFFI